MSFWKAIADNWREASDRIDAEYEQAKRLKAGVVLRDARALYDHYGVYVGNHQVIHFTNGEVQLTSIKAFKESWLGSVEVMGFSDEAIADTSLSQSVRRAYSKLGMKRYDLLANNCEHFALWCRTGKRFSSQAFGSGGATGATLSVSPARWVSDYFASEFGMAVSRTICVDDIIDD